MALGILCWNATHQHDDFGQRQLRYRAGVGVRRIEHRDTTLSCCFQVNLVGTDAEATHSNQLFGCVEDLFGELCT